MVIHAGVSTILYPNVFILLRFRFAFEENLDYSDRSASTDWAVENTFILNTVRQIILLQFSLHVSNGPIQLNAPKIWTSVEYLKFYHEKLFSMTAFILKTLFYCSLKHRSGKSRCLEIIDPA